MNYATCDNGKMQIINMIDTICSTAFSYRTFFVPSHIYSPHTILLQVLLDKQVRKKTLAACGW